MVGSHFLVGVNAFLFSAVVIVCVFLGYLLRKARNAAPLARPHAFARGQLRRPIAAWARCAALCRVAPPLRPVLD
jgi:hypothetical protein